MNIELGTILRNAKKSSIAMARLTTLEKNNILYTLADKLEEKTNDILQENKKDISIAKEKEFGEMLDRLLLTAERISSMAQGVRNVALLDDYVGKILSFEVLPSGIEIQKQRVPLGIVAMIYESRPNVTIDAAVLAIKSGNAIVLKGGKEAEHSNSILANIFREILEEYDVENAVQLMEKATRQDTADLLRAKGMIDVLIPRGGKGLIDFVSENAKVPIIQTGASVVHTFVDESADLEMAEKIIINEKTRRVSVCNALDTLLIHESIASIFLPKITSALQEKGVEIILSTSQEDDIFSTEWLDMKIAIRIVPNLSEALSHIEMYSLGHSESIITEDLENAELFLNTVDSACVYHNASTCFSDGSEFGLGAEIGISTQKLHVRGPFALEGLTTTKWKIFGAGQVRS